MSDEFEIGGEWRHVVRIFMADTSYSMMVRMNALNTAQEVIPVLHSDDENSRERSRFRPRFFHWSALVSTDRVQRTNGRPRR